MSLSDDQAKEAVSEFSLNAGDSILTFWDIELSAKGGRKIHIVRTKLLQFLSDKGGFHLYFYDRTSKIFKIIQDNNGLIEEASTEQIKKFIKTYIQSLPGAFDDITRDDLLEAVYKGSTVYFSEGYFEFLDPANIDFLKDSSNAAYFPFHNGVVCVTREHIEMQTYGELKKSIWKSQVIDFNIDLFEIERLGDIEFYQFISKICNDDKVRIRYVCAMIGYILHKYKDPTKPYMVVFGEETEDEKKGGGTGKGIMVTALSKLINVEQIDGKNFKVDKNFAFQRVKLDTHFVVVQDVRKNFDLEGYYSVTTEGMTIEKKNKDELYIPYSDSPKIGLTTNYTVSTTSNHAKRRVRNIEFGNFFHPGVTPADHFGHRLFDDWDKDQWNLFYNFMFACVRDYMLNGIPEMESTETLKKKQIRLSFGEEYWNWWEEYSGNGCGDWKLQGELYNSFLGESDFEKKDYLMKRFKRALEDSCNLFGYEIEHRKNRQASNKVEIRLIQKGEKTQQILQQGEVKGEQNSEIPF